MKAFVRLARLLRSPAEEWRVIDREDQSMVWLYLGWLLPMGLLAWLGTVLGFCLHDDMAADMASSARQPLVWLVSGVVLLFLQVTVLALLTRLLAPWFGARRDVRKALSLIAFSMAGIQIGLFLQPWLPGLQPLPFLLGAAWSVYLLYSGMQTLLTMPQPQTKNFSMLLVVSFLLINMLTTTWVARGNRYLGLPHDAAVTVVALSGEEEQGAPSASTQQKIQRADDKLDAAARQAGDALEQNDSLAAAQAARDAVSALASTVSGGKERRPLSEVRLKSWFPERLMGMSRQSLVVEPIGGTSSQSVQARALYQSGDGRSIELKVIDAGLAAALLAESAAAGPEAGRLTEETASAVSQSYQDGSRNVSVLRWKNSEHVEIQYVLGNGLRVSVDANGVSAEALDQGVRALGLEKLER
ncbi:MAG: Yip1 family protein [Lautropia sp.]|nr:Yip1 family protein [Lautropia sp.]